MAEPATETRLVEIAPLGKRLSTLRLCALATMRRSLVQHGQLPALTLFAPAAGSRSSMVQAGSRGS